MLAFDHAELASGRRSSRSAGLSAFGQIAEEAGVAIAGSRLLAALDQRSWANSRTVASIV